MNVKWWGARCDVNPTYASSNFSAIHGAVNLVTPATSDSPNTSQCNSSGTKNYAAAGAIYFPGNSVVEGKPSDNSGLGRSNSGGNLCAVYVVDQPIVLPRGDAVNLTFFGDGINNSQIQGRAPRVGGADLRRRGLHHQHGLVRGHVRVS